PRGRRGTHDPVSPAGPGPGGGGLPVHGGADRIAGDRPVFLAHGIPLPGPGAAGDGLCRRGRRPGLAAVRGPVARAGAVLDSGRGAGRGCAVAATRPRAASAGAGARHPRGGLMKTGTDRRARIELLRARALVERMMLRRAACDALEGLRPESLAADASAGLRAAGMGWLAAAIRAVRRYPLVLSLASSAISGVRHGSP